MAKSQRRTTELGKNFEVDVAANEERTRLRLVEILFTFSNIYMHVSSPRTSRPCDTGVDHYFFSKLSAKSFL